jgi:hypothetical protein
MRGYVIELAPDRKLARAKLLAALGEKARVLVQRPPINEIQADGSLVARGYELYIETELPKEIADAACAAHNPPEDDAEKEKEARADKNEKGLRAMVKRVLLHLIDKDAEVKQAIKNL